MVHIGKRSGKVQEQGVAMRHLSWVATLNQRALLTRTKKTARGAATVRLYLSFDGTGLTKISSEKPSQMDSLQAIFH